MGTTKRTATVFVLLAVALLATLLALSGCVDAGTSEQKKYTIKYFASEGGQIEGNPRQAVGAGSAATAVTAVPSESYEFDCWSDGNASAVRTDNAVESDFEVTALFKKMKYSVNYVATDRGEIVGEAVQRVEYGGTATAVTAVAKEGFRFAGWSDGVMTPLRQDSEIKGYFSVSAVFNKDTQYIIRYKSANRYGEVLGNKEQYVYDGDDTEIVKAIPNMGAKFMGWSDGVMTQERQDKDIRAGNSFIARFLPIMYDTIYAATEGGRVTGTGNQPVYPNMIVTAVARPEIEYEFVKWSDGVMTAERKDTITSDIEVTAIFKRKELSVTYKPNKGGGVGGEQEQKILYGSASSAVTAKADAGYEFLSWSDGVQTPRRQDSAVSSDIEVRATFAPINGVEYRVLMVNVTELHAELKATSGEMIKVDYVMTQVERDILKMLSQKFAAFLNDLFEGEVRFILDDYFTTQPLGRENLYRGMDGKFYTYGMEAKSIPEISHILNNYGSTMITFSMNDLENKLHCIGGGGRAKEAFLHLETIFGRAIRDGETLEQYLDYDSGWWNAVMTPHYLHEFIHTVEMQIELYTDGFMDLHNVCFYFGYENMDIKESFMLNLTIVDDKYVGIPPSFWKEWHSNNPSKKHIEATGFVRSTEMTTFIY